MKLISIVELERAINSARDSQPPVDGVLSPDLEVLAEVYGELVCSKCTAFDISLQPPARTEVLRRWLGPAAQAESA